jgi:hypothetical protein
LKRKFSVHLIGDCEIEIDDKVIDSVNDDWRSQFYNLQTKEDIVTFILLNMLQDGYLSNIDGFADQNDDDAYYTDIEWDTEVEEITDD